MTDRARRIVLFVMRIFGYGRLIVFLMGLATGLLLAPSTGAELRAKLQELAEGNSGTSSTA